jgi:hypothetical protein
VYFQRSQPPPTNEASINTTRTAIHAPAMMMGGRVAHRASHTKVPVARATIKKSHQRRPAVAAPKGSFHNWAEVVTSRFHP